MVPRRAKCQIVLQILSICEGKGAGKTRIVYAANLNFQIANDYLNMLIKNDLLVKDDLSESGLGDVALYRMTPRGIELLKLLKAIDEFIP